MYSPPNAYTLKQVPMPRRGHTPSRDENEAAFQAVMRLVGEAASENGKNPAAVALGRLGGLKGGKARANKLSARRRTAIARKAARARWKVAKR